MSEPNPTPVSNDRNDPWKIGVLVAAGMAVAAIATATVVGTLDDDAEDEKAPQVAAAAGSQPTQEVVEDCNRHAAAAARNTNEIVKDGVIGGALGAGVGAASGAIADGGDGAGKGAGIGAIVGVTAGTLYGLNEENRRTEAARHAYRSCMERNGYSG